MRLANPRADELLYLPLGGAGEIGMNAYLYGHKDAWILVDLGVSFGDPASTPGVDVFLPDLSAIEALGSKLKGVVVTHAHEDHIGALVYVSDLIDCPVYVTPFAANILKRKLSEEGQRNALDIRVIQPGGRFEVADFSLRFLPVTHSVPEAQALQIGTDLGQAVHTGDWKIDKDPVLGAPFDPAPFEALGEAGGLLALLGDSTNAPLAGHSGYEGEAAVGLEAMVREAKGRVAVTCFATNVARVKSIADVALKTGRSLCLIGRSMKRTTEAAREEGLLKDFPKLISEEEVDLLPRDQVLILCTGSQGEPRAALARIARGGNSKVRLGEGDRLILSARTIPGNEEEVARILNQLAAAKVEVVGEAQARVHVSGHARAGELEQMIQWTQPKLVVPLHGEWQHLRAHAALAERLQVPQALVAANGSLVRIQKDRPAEIIDAFPVGRWLLDGDRLIDASSPMFRARRKLNAEGMVSLALSLDEDGQLVADPSVRAFGSYDEDQDGNPYEEVADRAVRALDGMRRAAKRDDTQVEEVVMQEVRRTFRELTGKKPLVFVHVGRVA